MDTYAPAIAAMPGVVKARRHLFEEVALTLDHPGVAMFTELDKQYQAAVEVVMDNEQSLLALALSPEWSALAASMAKNVTAAHAAHVSRCLTTKYDGTITLLGVRGAATADAIVRLGAQNQTEPAVSNWFLPLQPGEPRRG